MSDEIKMMTIDLYGESLTLPEDQAKKLIASRDDNKARMTDMQTSMETRVAAEAKAKEDADNAETRRLAEVAAGEGKYDQLETLHKAELAKGKGQLIKMMINIAVAKNEKVARSAVSDVVESLYATGNNKVEGESLLVSNADGSTTAFDAHLTDFLSTRDHYLAHTTPPSSGGTGSNNGTEVPSITREEYNNNSKKFAGEIAKGTLIVKD